MAPIAFEAAWAENAGLVARAIAARFLRVPAGTAVVRAGTVLSTGCDVAAARDDPAIRGGKAPIRPTIVGQEAQALRGATPSAFAKPPASAEPRASAEPCATGTGAILGFARLACVPPIALPATRLDQGATPCAMVADAASSDTAIALFHTA